MNRIGIALCFCASIVTIYSCDDGDIYEKTSEIGSTGKTVHLQTTIEGMTSWPSDYAIVLAGYADSRYSVISKTIPNEGEVDITLSGIDETVKTIEVCAQNKLRERIATFYSVSVENLGEKDTLTIDETSINTSMFTGIQKAIFSTACVTCHGGSNSAAADLFLTEGNSYSSLINISSTRHPDGMYRVKPYDADASFISKVVNSDDEASVLKFDHANMIDYNYTKLIDDWINNGASE